MRAKEGGKETTGEKNLHDSSVGGHLDAASRKSVEIQEYCTSQKEEPFWSKNWCKFHFLTALIIIVLNFDDEMYKPVITIIY